MGFGEIAPKFLLAGLFIISIISFGTVIGNNYGKDDSFMQDEKIGFTEIQNQVEETNEQAEKWEGVFRSDNLFVSVGGIILFSIWGIIQLIWTSIFGLYNVIFGTASDILGIPSIVLATMTTILILTLIFQAWRTVKAGE